MLRSGVISDDLWDFLEAVMPAGRGSSTAIPAGWTLLDRATYGDRPSALVALPNRASRRLGRTGVREDSGVGCGCRRAVGGRMLVVSVVVVLGHPVVSVNL